MWISLHMDTYKILGQEAERQFTRTEDIDVYFCMLGSQRKFQEEISSTSCVGTPLANTYLSPTRNGGLLAGQLIPQRCHLLPSPCLAQAQGKSNNNTIQSLLKVNRSKLIQLPSPNGRVRCACMGGIVHVISTQKNDQSQLLMKDTPSILKYKASKD